MTVIAIVVLAGVSALLNMPRREDPKITNLSALCYAIFPGATGEQVEEQVGKKIENYLFRYSEVNKSHTITTCKDGMVFVNIELNPAVKDPQVFWAKLREDLLQLKLLKGSTICDEPEPGAGYTLPKDVLMAQVNLTQAETDLLSAQLAYRVALKELTSITIAN